MTWSHFAAFYVGGAGTTLWLLGSSMLRAKEEDGGGWILFALICFCVAIAWPAALASLFWVDDE